jgi:class 3 adenylate cyclase
MSTIFDTFGAIVCNHAGTIKDFAGDAIYAFWDHGLSAKRDQAQLACQAALEQAEALKGLHTANSFKAGVAFDKLQMGWGITTGSVTMAHYGSRAADLALVGDATNLAFRLSCMANKDLSAELVMCSETADLVGDLFPVVDLGLVSVRGRSGRERVYGIASRDPLEKPFCRNNLNTDPMPEMTSRYQEFTLLEDPISQG